MTEKQFYWPGRRPDDPAHDMLAAYLVVDIQRNLEWARDLANQVKAVQEGKIKEWERIGNAYRLKVTADGTLIEDLVDEDGPTRKISLEELGAAVDAWIAELK